MSGLDPGAVVCPTCGGWVAEDEPVLNVQEILLVVCEHFGLSTREIKSHRRTQVFCRPRQIAMYFCREKTDLSYPIIGRLIGGRDHTTIMNGIRVIDRKLVEDPSVKRDVDIIRRKLEAGIAQSQGGDRKVVELKTGKRV